MNITSEQQIKQLGQRLGASLKGGELIELIGDIGAGKTTLTRGIAAGLGVVDTLQSPTFTISREYDGSKLRLVHYDFYRLSEPGIMTDELSETLSDSSAVVVIEWSDIARGVLPDERIKIEILPDDSNPNYRDVKITIPKSYNYINLRDN